MLKKNPMSKRTNFCWLLSLFILLQFSCQKNIFEDDTGGNGGGNNQTADWEPLEFETERLIKNLYGTPFQLYLITDNEFARFNEDLELVEKRTLIPQGIGLSRPVLSDNIFTRITTNSAGKQVIEFHLARNPAGVKKFVVDDIELPTDDFFELEIIQRSLGAFNDSETQFLIPAKVENGGDAYAVLYVFEITFNSTFDEFVSIEFNRIDLPDLITDATNISNIVNVRYFKEHFFVSTKKGGYRISEELEVDKIFPSSQWIRDYFVYQDTLYMTGLNSFDLHQSPDNGLEWTRLNKNSKLKMVENVNGLLFNQEVGGQVFLAADPNLCDEKEVVYTSDIPTGNLAAFYGLAFFQEQYYLSADNRIFHISDIVTE
ncbi:MAG: hypothetical protein ACJAVF_003221 [Paraglaciecola sp.]